jgi:cell division protein FtsB
VRLRGSALATHDEFEEICASASLGKASAHDLARLERHVLECSDCWQAYHNSVSVAAYEFAAAAQDPKLSLKEAKECLDSDLFMRRWFDRAEREGIAFSAEVRSTSGRQQRPPAHFSPSQLWKQYSMPLATAALVFLALSAGFAYWTHRSSAVTLDSGSQVASSTQVAKRVADLEAANRSLEAQINRLNRERDDAEARLHATENNGQKAMVQEQMEYAAERNVLQKQALQLQMQLSQGQRELGQLQAVASNARREAEEQRKRAGDLENTLVGEQAELSDITEKLKDQSGALARERDLLAMGRDVTDLMGARNLHILDVADTDTRGNKQRAFGRIFFTEGKSLVFYAYDLNEAKMQKANYQYQVWAKKEGSDRQVRRLGIFYSDDKAQHRWVFKCHDANVVKEIDSVFVTLGRPNSDPNRPEGSRLMFAYLHSAPNHP